MVWTGSMQLNSDVTDIGQFEGIYPRFMDNTIVQKSDGSYWICGENVGTTEKVVHGAEADYTVVCSYEFCLIMQMLSKMEHTAMIWGLNLSFA